MKGYPDNVREFVKVRMEQTPNNTQIARDVKNKFSFIELIKERELDAIRRTIGRFREKTNTEAQRAKAKRLFFDIETGYYILKVRTWQLKNFKRYFDWKDIEREKEIVCISYKWQNEDKVHTLDWRMGEKEMLKEFIKIAGEADELVGHNGDRFDLPFIRTRCAKHGVLMFPTYRTLDTLKKARGGFNFASNALGYIGEFFGIGGKLDHDGFDLWKDVVEGNQPTMEDIFKAAKKHRTFSKFMEWHNQNWGISDRLDEMIQYCERDVVLLEDVFFVMSPFITHNNNFAVLEGGAKWDCPHCASENTEPSHTYTTPMGIIRRMMKCNDCKQQFKISNKTFLERLEYLQMKEAQC